MKHLLNNLTEQEKNSIREQHTGGMKVSNYRFKELLENKLGNSKPLVEQFYDEDDTDFEDEELYSGAPERLVKHMDSGKIVGTHKHGVGYTPNKHGRSLGHSNHPTSIPNFTKFDDEDDYDFEGDVETRLESRTKRNYLINEQQKTPFNDTIELENVKKIQAQLGFTGADLDGKLGPKTLAAITAKLTSPGGKVDNATVKQVEGDPNLSETTTNIWSIVIGYMNEFEDKIKSNTVETSNGKFDNVDALAAVKELRIFCEDKRDGHTPRPLSQLSNIIFKSIQSQIKNLDSDSQNKYFASGKTTTTNRY